MSKDNLNLPTTNYDAGIAHQVHCSKTRKQSRCLCVQYCLVSAFVCMHGFSSRPCLWAALASHSSSSGLVTMAEMLLTTFGLYLTWLVFGNLWITWWMCCHDTQWSTRHITHHMFFLAALPCISIHDVGNASLSLGHRRSQLASYTATGDTSWRLRIYDILNVK